MRYLHNFFGALLALEFFAYHRREWPKRYTTYLAHVSLGPCQTPTRVGAHNSKNREKIHQFPQTQPPPTEQRRWRRTPCASLRPKATFGKCRDSLKWESTSTLQYRPRPPPDKRFFSSNTPSSSRQDRDGVRPSPPQYIPLSLLVAQVVTCLCSLQLGCGYGPLWPTDGTPLLFGTLTRVKPTKPY